eukprot:TRINITY_DN1036_c0_g1_i2.p2 TRINITY_DN1036_c0_g1~~TRINITY_DN1036_c0_g1_i2.p2  ORF type:complete len:162 (+),score=48.05 TRINITY_DN1036_c0_g1_i2:75-560(+)
MLRSLVGSEMCIRDSINAEYGGGVSDMEEHCRPWSEVAAAVSASTAAPAKPMVLVCFMQQWCPPAVHTARMLLDAQKELAGFADVLMVDADSQDVRDGFPGVVCTPALVLFYKGALVRFQRQSWPEDSKLMGCPELADLIDTLHCARQTSEQGGGVVLVEW